MTKREGEPNWRDDKWNIAALLLLYLLQGVPIGLSASIPFILQSKNVSYADQAIFSFASWPFSLKLLWAPIVDSFWFNSVGRRKSWIIPIQILTSFLMLLLSFHVEDLTTNPTTSDVVWLTAAFLILFFCMATQDVAVDGWALTLLNPKNVCYAGTCNTIGQNLGYMLAYVVFLILNSPEVWNKFRPVPLETGIVSLSSFIAFWGVVLFLSTILVGIYIPEAPTRENLSVLKTYRQIWLILKLPSVQTLGLIMLTRGVGYASASAIGPLKLVEKGMPGNYLALMSLIILPFVVIAPVLGSEYSLPTLSSWLGNWPLRYSLSFIFGLIVAFVPNLTSADGYLLMIFYPLLFTILFVSTIISTLAFASQMGYYNTVADPTIGGTYMTLLNSITNMGDRLATTFVLAMVDPLTFRSCPEKSCDVLVDGFVVLILVSVGASFVWYRWAKFQVNKLERLPATAWRAKDKDSFEKEP